MTINTDLPSAVSKFARVTIAGNEYTLYITPDGDIECLEFKDEPFDGRGLYVLDGHVINPPVYRPFLDMVQYAALEYAEEHGGFEGMDAGDRADRYYEGMGEGR